MNNDYKLPLFKFDKYDDCGKERQLKNANCELYFCKECWIGYKEASEGTVVDNFLELTKKDIKNLE